MTGKLKPFGIIVLAAAIGLAMSACNDDDSGGSPTGAGAAPAANRVVVDGFFQSYEAFVVELETLSARASITALDMLPFAQRTLEFAERTIAIESDPGFVPADAARLASLTLRYAAAMIEINNRMQGAVPAIPGFPRL